MNRVEIYEGTPFKEPLRFEMFTEINGFYVFYSRPDLLVRIMKPTPSHIETDERVRLLAGRAKHWREFGKYPGIHVPQFYIVAGEPIDDTFDGVKMKEALYLVVERINGKNLEEIAIKDNPKRANKLEDMCCGLIDYLSDRYKDGGLYLFDQRIDQYVYGTTEKDQEPKVYWVDLDWEAARFSPHDLPDIEYMIHQLEDKSLMKFNKARRRIKAFKSHIDRDK